MPVRSVSNWGGNIIGSFPSLKNGHAVKYESTIERDLLFFLEYDAAVLSYEMQPLQISASDEDGVFHTYIPDMLVERTTGRLLIECKPAALLNEARAQRQIKMGQDWAKEQGYNFAVITDTDLRTGYQLANLKHLWRYARLAVPQAVTAHCRMLLHNQPEGLHWSTLVAQLNETAPPLTIQPYLAHLLFRHIIATDLNQRISSTSVVTLTV